MITAFELVRRAAVVSVTVLALHAAAAGVAEAQQTAASPASAPQAAALPSSARTPSTASGQEGSMPQASGLPQTSGLPQASGLPQVPGQPVDRVIAIVNGDLVLDSDVDEERRFEAIQPYRYDSTNAEASSRESVVERLVNRSLILQQAQLIPGAEIDDADVDKEITELRKQIPACRAEDCGTDVGWTRYLGEHGFTPAEFRARWKQRMQVLAFIEERFRQGVKIEPAEIKAYYDKTLLPKYAAQHAKPPALESISDRIEEVLLEQQVSALLRDWLKSLRAQGSVVVMHPGEVAP